MAGNSVRKDGGRDGATTHDTRTLFEDGAALWTRKTFVGARALLGVGGLMFAFEEELLLFYPRLGERGVELLTSGFTDLLAAGGLVLVMRRQGSSSSGSPASPRSDSK